MEKMNLILNLIIIAYIVIKEMSNIKRGINTVKEYITVLKTQVIAKTIYDNVHHLPMLLQKRIMMAYLHEK